MHDLPRNVRLLPLLLALVLVHTALPAAEPLRLIAHRGGVVNESIIENNLAAIEEAAKRGYWMVEADLQSSRDGVPVVHHDQTLERFYGEPRKLTDLNWPEIARLRSTPGNEHPLQFAEYAAACKGRLQIMLDIKGDEPAAEFLDAIEATLVEHDLLNGAYVLGSDRTKRHFHDKARISANAEALFAAAERGEPVSQRYFLFDRGSRLTAPIVKRAQALKVPVVAAINRIRYPDDDQEALTLAKADIVRLRELGVTRFQIDSQYDVWLLDPARK
ncbi:MAG: glycerophosphodiester phosphodiesterase family protein [Planctomycetaceae bacterium]